jgi:hypothetical protein
VRASSPTMLCCEAGRVRRWKNCHIRALALISWEAAGVPWPGVAAVTDRVQSGVGGRARVAGPRHVDGDGDGGRARVAAAPWATAAGVAAGMACVFNDRWILAPLLPDGPPATPGQVGRRRRPRYWAVAAAGGVRGKLMVTVNDVPGNTRS